MGENCVSNQNNNAIENNRMEQYIVHEELKEINLCWNQIWKAACCEFE